MTVPTPTRVVLFDLDGTITRHDTLTPYALRYVIRHPWRLPRLSMVLPALVGFALGSVDRGRLKGALIRASLGSLRADELRLWTAAFLDALFRGGLFDAARNEIDRLRRDGALLVLMSASPDLYVPAIGERLGFARTICSRVRWRGAVLDGRLEGPNCRGEEKARRLGELRLEFPAARFGAYGNSRADLAHMRKADEGVFVNGQGKALAAAQAAGMRLVRWE